MAAQSKTTTRRTKAPATPKPAPAASTGAVQAEPGASGPKGKLGAVVTLLRRPDGAQIAELMAATGWQAHSVRGAISGALKKKLGLTITSDKTEAGRAYRIIDIAAGADA
jgi:hypothetical protein